MKRPTFTFLKTAPSSLKTAPSKLEVVFRIGEAITPPWAGISPVGAVTMAVVNKNK